MSIPEIRKWFNKLVDKSDWEGSNKEEILKFLKSYSHKEAWGQMANNKDILKATRPKNAI
jgi:DNA phosphorothioation-dependent restriction protein DptG